MVYTLFHNKFYLYLSEHGPEFNYIAGTLITDLTNLKDSPRYFQLSQPARIGIIVGWNYLDAVFDFLYAVSLFTNNTDYRHWSNKIKGIINILEGIELFLLSYNLPLNQALGLKEATSLAGISFVLAMVGDFVMASIDFHYVFKETQLMGWLIEKVKEYQFAQIHSLDTTQLVKDIRARCKTYVAGDVVKANTITQLLQHLLADDMEKGAPLELFIDKLVLVSNKHKDRDKCIQENMDQACKLNRTFLMMKTLSTAGMTLLAVAGFLDNATDEYSSTFATGLIITSVVGSYYFISNAERLTDTVGHAYNRFFPAKPVINNLVLQRHTAPTALLT